MTVNINGHEYNDCDKCHHLVDTKGHHFHDYIITRNCAKNAISNPPLPSEVGYCSNLWMEKLNA